jgi:hypothetical protein
VADILQTCPFSDGSRHFKPERNNEPKKLMPRGRAIMGIALTGGRKASIIGLPLAWNAGGLGVKEPALIV